MTETLKIMKREFDPSHVAFGDLYLEDIRDYRSKQMADTGIGLLFPIWGQETGDLARSMVAAGLKATLTCVNPKQMPKDFAGREFDEDLLNTLPDDVDPCGENGEFHSFVHAGPMFQHDLKVATGEIVERDGFCFADIAFTP